MKIYIGETSIFYVPTPLPEKIHLDIACHKVYCRERLGGCIYNTYTKKPIKNAKITIKNHCHCETSFTNRKGHYKLYAPFINTFCDIYISKHGFKHYQHKHVWIDSYYQIFELSPKCN